MASNAMATIAADANRIFMAPSEAGELISWGGPLPLPRPARSHSKSVQRRNQVVIEMPERLSDAAGPCRPAPREGLPRQRDLSRKLGEQHAQQRRGLRPVLGGLRCPGRSGPAPGGDDEL